MEINYQKIYKDIIAIKSNNDSEMIVNLERDINSMPNGREKDLLLNRLESKKREIGYVVKDEPIKSDSIKEDSKNEPVKINKKVGKKVAVTIAMIGTGIGVLVGGYSLGKYNNLNSKQPVAQADANATASGNTTKDKTTSKEENSNKTNVANNTTTDTNTTSDVNTTNDTTTDETNTITDDTTENLSPVDASTADEETKKYFRKLLADAYEYEQEEPSLEEQMKYMDKNKDGAVTGDEYYGGRMVNADGYIYPNDDTYQYDEYELQQYNTLTIYEMDNFDKLDAETKEKVFAVTKYYDSYLGYIFNLTYFDQLDQFYYAIPQDKAYTKGSH